MIKEFIKKQIPNIGAIIAIISAIILIIIGFLGILANVNNETGNVVSPIFVTVSEPRVSSSKIIFPAGTTDWKIEPHSTMATDYYCEINGEWYRCLPIFPELK